jgi:hypothetical protein
VVDAVDLLLCEVLREVLHRHEATLNVVEEAHTSFKAADDALSFPNGFSTISRL